MVRWRVPDLASWDSIRRSRDLGLLSVSRGVFRTKTLRPEQATGVFEEGWAVYTEQMMLDQGYGAGDLELRFMQLRFLLLAAGNAVLDHQMHCTQMTDEEAERFVNEEMMQSKGNARLKVIRAKQSSVQLSTYFAGRTAFMQVRQQIQREAGPTFDLGRYHEAVLEQGSVPVKYLADLVRARLQKATSMTAQTSADSLPTKHPRGLLTLFFTEMWERFSYYGMRALLVLFMVDAVKKGGFGLDDRTVTAIYGLYTSFAYLAALPGGWIGDRLLGAQRAVWIGGCIIALGHFTLALPFTRTFFFGLLLIIIGTALLKPNMSVMVAQLYPEGGARRDAGYTIFYMGVNLGAALGPLVCSWLGEKFNWHYGFAAAGVGMVFGLVQFRFTARHLGEAGLQPQGDTAGRARGWWLVRAGVAALVVVVALAFTGAQFSSGASLPLAGWMQGKRNASARFSCCSWSARCFGRASSRPARR